MLKYQDDPNHASYILDSEGTQGTRKDYCIPFNDFKSDEMYEDIVDFRKYVVSKIHEFYGDECARLMLTMIEALKLKDIDNMLNQENERIK